MSAQETLKYVVVDDDELSRLSITSAAAHFDFLENIGSFSTALEAAEFIDRFSPDIVFTDIEMPGISGLDLLRRLTGQVSAPVLVTSHPEFAMEGFELEAFDYLLKPFTNERFTRCALRLRDFFWMRSKSFAFDQEQESEHIIIKQGYDKYKILLNDLLYLEAMKDYTRIFTKDGQYLVLTTLTAMHEKLPQDKFIRIHRSYVVNRQKIDSIAGQKILMPGHELPVGKMYRQTLNSLL